MPTSGTHVTIIQRLASEPAYRALLGDPDPTLPETDPAALKMRYACLGAVGPDILYALADYGGDLQDLENVLVKIGGTFSCVGELMGKLDRYIGGLETNISLGVVDSIKETATLVSGVMSESLLALFSAGVNLWPCLEPARQKDLPRTQWYWADYLHYIRSGRFASTLVRNSTGNDFHHAYALGYLTHYVTDVVGHPYVNQVVGAPWRLAWQRHHLVENFIDAYVWDRWHSPLPKPAPPSVEEQPLDRLVSTPNVIGGGAPMTFARINDWIKIGTSGIDPIDSIIDMVCKKIEQGLFDIGVVEDIEPIAPAAADFKKWTEFISKAIREAYATTTTPVRLMSNFVIGGAAAGRTDGFPTPGDIAGAYGIFRVMMRIATEEKIKEPQAPNIITDISADVAAMLAAITADLAGATPPPASPMGGAFSLSALVAALVNAVVAAAQMAAAVFSAIRDFLAGLVGIGATIVSDSIKYALYLVNKALFALYRAFRDVLVLQAYATPYTDEIGGMIGSLDVQTLWRSLGNAAAPPVVYPHEEIEAERVNFLSGYSPAVPLTAPAEKPPLSRAAPYTATTTAGPAGPVLTLTLPDDFIEAPLGTHDMFGPRGPQRATRSGGIKSFASAAKNFGGALANSRKAIDRAQAGAYASVDQNLPDYNLDGDRGYAWPCWDVDLMSGPDPLAPGDPANAGGIATVRAVRAA